VLRGSGLGGSASDVAGRDVGRRRGSSAGVLRAARDIMPGRRTATTAVEQLADLAGLGHEPDQAVLIPNTDAGRDAAFQGESCSSHAGEGREDHSGAETLHFAGVWFG
jgi:hypothetical protein